MDGLRRFPRLVVAALLALSLSACAAIQSQRVAGRLSEDGLAGVRWGLVVETMAGRTLVAINADERFTPASNTKLFVTAAAMHRLKTDAPDPAAGTSLWLAPRSDGPPDLVLLGGGDARLEDFPNCAVNCLAMLADAAVANGVSDVRAVVGDDRLFADERWGPGMSWNNIQTRSGTASGALVVNDNEVVIEVRPGAAVGQKAIAEWRAGDDFMRIDMAAVTTDDRTDVGIVRAPGSDVVRVHGAIAIGAAVQRERLGVDDPALFAAWRMKRLLEARGVKVGGIEARHRPLELADDPALRRDAAAAALPHVEGVEIGRIVAPALAEDVRITLKVSQNMHADVMLRRLGRIEGGGSFADGVKAVEGVLAEAGMERQAYDFADGSGMSTYNRVTPRMVASFLRWTQEQEWGEAWRGMLPVGGVDGTIGRRFRGTALEGRVFAKTGTLNAVNALSGFMLAKSGRMLAFSAYANDQPSGADPAVAALDSALVAIAEAN